MAELVRKTTRIVLRNDTHGNWEAVKDTAVLLKGEIGIEFDPSLESGYKTRMKVGDGIHTWSQLAYFGESAEQKFAKVYQVEVASGADHIAAITEAVGDAEKNPGDIAIVKELINAADETKGIAEHRQYTAYVFDGENWAAMDGNYSAENVYFKEDLTYTTAIGVLTAPTKAEGSKQLAATGKNVKQVLSAIMAKEEQGSTTAPALSVSSTNIGAYEVGSSVAVAYSVTGTAGSYTYGPATGVTWSNYSVSFNGETKTTSSGTFSAVTVEDDTS